MHWYGTNCRQETCTTLARMLLVLQGNAALHPVVFNDHLTALLQQLQRSVQRAFFHQVGLHRMEPCQVTRGPLSLCATLRKWGV